MVEQLVHWYTLEERPITDDSKDIFIIATVRNKHFDGIESSIKLKEPRKCADFVQLYIEKGVKYLIAKDGFAYSLGEVDLWTDEIKGGFRY